MPLFKPNPTFGEQWEVLFKVAKYWRSMNETARSCYLTNECLLPSGHYGDCLGLDPGPAWDRALKLTTEWFYATTSAPFCERETECLRPFGHAGECWPASGIRPPREGSP